MRTTYGLIGHPLVHSFSQRFFTEKFQQEGIDAEYLNFDIPDISLLPVILQEHPTLRGLNVTLPYKEKVIPYLEELSPKAQTIGAVNCIRIEHIGDQTFLKGYNADVIGFMESIRPLLKPHHTRALILGTGGASKAIRHGLYNMGISYQLVSRSPKDDILGYDQLSDKLMKEYTVIVNCSPVGTFPKTDKCPDIPYHSLTDKHLLYDLVYNPEKTLFLQRGESQGALIKNGLEMLHLQALASWKFWHETE